MRAYSKAVQEGLKNSCVIEKKTGFLLKIKTDYNGIGKIQYLLGQRGLHITASDYTDVVVVETLVPEEECDRSREAVTEGTLCRAELTEQTKLGYAGREGEKILFSS